MKTTETALLTSLAKTHSLDKAEKRLKAAHTADDSLR